MKRSTDYRVEQRKGDLALLRYRDRDGKHYSVNVNARDGDEVEVLQEKEKIYVVIRNRAFKYVGIQAFRKQEPLGEQWIKGQGYVESLLGMKGLEFTAMQLGRKMTRRLEELIQKRASEETAESETLEIELEDLTTEAQQAYHEFYNGEPPLGPIAILEKEHDEEASHD